MESASIHAQGSGSRVQQQPPSIQESYRARFETSGADKDAVRVKARMHSSLFARAFRRPQLTSGGDVIHRMPREHRHEQSISQGPRTEINLDVVRDDAQDTHISVLCTFCQREFVIPRSSLGKERQPGQRARVFSALQCLNHHPRPCC